MTTSPDEPVDLLVIGGGINGCGIARDAAGRGLSVLLAEKADLASATSSASTKLFHGGLRYLEFFEFRLVREALKERETLLRAMPHISWPMRFVLPLHPEMRFDTQTPTSRLLSVLMPWAKGRRPDWLIRLGLFIYDSLGGRKLLPAARSVDLTEDPVGKPLKSQFRKAYEYSDCWVDDARLVVLNAKDAQRRGVKVRTGCEVVGAERGGDVWQVSVKNVDTGQRQVVRARAVVNAAGPWVAETLKQTLGIETSEKVRLVRGSHIVTRKLFDHDHCYFLQGADGRIVFAIPYQNDFTLIGTTDQDHGDPSQPAVCTEEEEDYLCRFVSGYFDTQVTRDDIVWTYSGVRPLYDDGASSATAATRDYVLSLDRSGAPLLSVFGGKITTYRKLAESAMERLKAVFPDMPDNWTAGVALPGGDFAVDGVAALIEKLVGQYPFLGERRAIRLIRQYGTDAFGLLGGAASDADLGEDFGAGLTEVELRWLMSEEYARSAEDVIWRRTKLGLVLSEQQVARIEEWMRDARMTGGQNELRAGDRSGDNL
ncbi:glycerol-3-phosphate dehydrogenase [Qingshengfaniella alkalisoli]|uniref:Glycerol-3-phosphate dehydrogenase n=1 Tax=Qingshengfaniella alkalisoli TaxID=2599296 RepID=A0A5B8IVL1_9RHOB|nr:glycerol-3-phosphate dehydrogenase [Qingshengfaniella alkalisoli]QDY69654.1 glycerol-3-phosphate dehydrogenase [Qingshengfaniella alkalisoli]